MTAGKTPARRETSLEGPGHWYRVTSSKVSTISVQVYDSDSKAPPQNLDPNGHVDIVVKSGLFLAPVQTYSGTAEGTYAKI